jgi:hypothetical protein
MNRRQQDVIEYLKEEDTLLLSSTVSFIETAIAFWSEKKALAFEKYLRSHLGRAFSKRHL